MDPTVELGRNPVSKHQIQPEYGDEQAVTGLQNPSRETKFSGAINADREIFIFPGSADHVQDRQPYRVDPYSCYYIYCSICLTIYYTISTVEHVTLSHAAGLQL